MKRLPQSLIDSRAERLKSARLAAGFKTAAKAARHLALHPVTVRAHENGQNGFPADVAAKYADAYSVTMNWLLLGNDEIRPTSKATKSGDAVEPVAETTPGIAMTSLPDEAVQLQIDTKLSLSKALGILAILNGDEK